MLSGSVAMRPKRVNFARRSTSRRAKPRTPFAFKPSGTAEVRIRLETWQVPRAARQEFGSFSLTEPESTPQDKPSTQAVK